MESHLFRETSWPILCSGMGIPRSDMLQCKCTHVCSCEVAPPPSPPTPAAPLPDALTLNRNFLPGSTATLRCPGSPARIISSFEWSCEELRGGWVDALERAGRPEGVRHHVLCSCHHCTNLNILLGCALPRDNSSCAAPCPHAAPETTGCQRHYVPQLSDIDNAKYQVLLQCIGRDSCQLYVDPAWWQSTEEFCTACPACIRQLSITHR